MAKIIIDIAHDIPYVGGASLDGSVIYLDRNLPASFVDSTGQSVPIHPFLVLHEVVESSLLDKLGMKYNEAHRLAMAAESAALLQAGFHPDEYYHAIYMHQRDTLVVENILSAPTDLNLLPYEEDGLNDIIKAIRRAQK